MLDNQPAFLRHVHAFVLSKVLSSLQVVGTRAVDVRGEFSINDYCQSDVLGGGVRNPTAL